MLATLTTAEWIEVAVAAGTGLAALVALTGLWLTQSNERRRSQPVVIAHEAAQRQFARAGSEAMWTVEAYLTSEGGGPAFNVRFGVEFVGVRYPYRSRIEDPESGNIQRVIRPGERHPGAGAWPIALTSLAIWGRAAESIESGKRGTLDAARVYWARYENAEGKTWETRNPGDRSAKLDIRRIRFPRWRDRRDTQKRKRAGQYDVEWERKVLEELRQLRSDTEAAEADAQAGTDTDDA